MIAFLFDCCIALVVNKPMLLTIESGKVHKGLLLTGFREIMPESRNQGSQYFSLIKIIAIVAAADLCA